MCTAEICPSPKRTKWSEICYGLFQFQFMHMKRGTVTVARIDSMRYVNHVLKRYLNFNVSNVHKRHHETYTHSESDLHTLKCNCDVRTLLACDPLDPLSSQGALK